MQKTVTSRMVMHKLKTYTFTFLAMLILLGIGSQANAQAVVSVKAHSEITLQPIRRTNTGVLVTGNLVTRVSRDPIADRKLSVTLGTNRQVVRSDEDGRFRAEFGLPLLPNPSLVVAFRGDRHYSKAQTTLSEFRVSRNPLTLGVEVPEQVSYPDGQLAITITSRTENGPVSVPLDVFIYHSAQGGHNHRPIHKQSAQTTSDGYITIQRNAADLGDPGYKRIEIYFRGNHVLNPQRQTATLTLVSDTILTLNPTSDSISMHSQWLASGTLQNSAKRGLRSHQVRLMSDDRILGTTTTTEGGYFETQIDAGVLGLGKHSVYAVFKTEVPWIRSARSTPIEIEIQQQAPKSTNYTVLGFILTTTLVVVFVFAQHHPWRRISSPKAATQQENNASIPTAPIAPGFQARSTKLLGHLGRKQDRQFSGQVIDVLTGHAIQNAIVTVRSTTEAPNPRTTDANGHFCFEPLADGAFQVEVVAPGFITESFSIAIPHKGQFRAANIHLLPVRERIFEIYRKTAQPLLQSPEQWDVTTPRQLLLQVRSQKPAPALAALTDYVEWAYFSGQQILEHDTIAETQRRAQQASNEHQDKPS